ncbi:MAG: thioredoxin family protein, partial [Cetobacterium sp.]
KTDILIFVGAERCKNCRDLQPILEELLPEFEGKFEQYHLDADKEKPYLEENKIKSIPTLIIYRNGELIGRLIGSHSIDEVEEFLEQ